MARSKTSQEAPGKSEAVPGAESMPPLPVGIYHGGKLVRTTCIPDPRKAFCREYGRLAEDGCLPAGYIARPLPVKSAAMLYHVYLIDPDNGSELVYAAKSFAEAERFAREWNRDPLGFVPVIAPAQAEGGAA